MGQVFWAFERVLCMGFTVTLFVSSLSVPGQESSQMQMARDAIRDGNAPDLVALLKGGLDPNSIDAEGMTLITYAVMSDRESMIETLLANGSNPNTDGGLALALAALSDNITAVRALVDKGADVNAQAGLYHSAPLHWACKNGNLEMTAFLLDRGAQVNAVNSGGWTPLIAASSKDADIVRLLLAKGAHVDQRDGYGYTSLMYAAKNGNVEVIQVLLNAGAKTNLRAPGGETAADLAKKSRSEEAVRMLTPGQKEAPQQEETLPTTPTASEPTPSK